MCTLVQHGNEPYLKYQFMDGKMRSMELSKVQIVPKHQLKDDFFGEKNTALTGTMELVNIVNQGIAEGAKNAATYRFMAQLNSKAFDEDLRKERERFDRSNFQTGSGGGLLLFGNQYTNIKELSQRQFTVDPQQMALIKANVYDYFGVSEKIIRNEATGDELDAFFNGSIEPFAMYMSVGAKISMAQQLGDRGVLTIDEIRELFNYAPLPDGKGQYTPIRGEYKDVQGTDADEEDKKDE